MGFTVTAVGDSTGYGRAPPACRGARSAPEGAAATGVSRAHPRPQPPQLPTVAWTRAPLGRMGAQNTFSTTGHLSPNPFSNHSRRCSVGLGSLLTESQPRGAQSLGPGAVEWRASPSSTTPAFPVNPPLPIQPPLMHWEDSRGQTQSHMADPDAAPGSCLQPGSAQAIVAVQGQTTEGRSGSLALPLLRLSDPSV